MMEMDVYKSSRAAAENAAESMREGLRALGVPEFELETIRPNVLATGRPVVSLGAWRLDVIEKIAAVLQLQASATEDHGIEA